MTLAGSINFILQNFKLELRKITPPSGVTKFDIFRYSDPDFASTEFIKNLNSKGYKLNKTTCPICASTGDVLFRANEGFEFSICHCGMVYQSIQLDELSLNEFYSSGQYQSLCMGGLSDEDHFDLELNVMSETILLAIKLSGFNKLTGIRILEIGCGSGGILSKLDKYGAIVEGFDIDPERIKFGLQRGVPNLRVGDALELEQIDIEMPDIVIISNVLEHLPDLETFFSKLKHKYGGTKVKIYIDVPNIHGIASYGQQWSDFFHIAHLWYFSPDTLRVLLENYGLNILYEFIRPAAMTLVCEYSDSAIQLRAYDEAKKRTKYALISRGMEISE